MPLARAISRIIVTLFALAVAACESDLTPSARSELTRIPPEVRSGVATMVIRHVEPNVSREEVSAALQSMIANAPVCLPWPALWLEAGDRNSFVVRYDLMARDWGESSVAAAEARMQEFLAMGYLTMRAVNHISPRAIEYSLTGEGLRRLNGVIGAGRRPDFCAPSERRLVEITTMEWGEYDCGNLHVTFTHVADDWPSWARTESLRMRAAAGWPPIGTPAAGSVSLGRQWYRRHDLPPGFDNGALRSLCYDAERREVTGNDLDLAATSVE
jgi:hypothetical protein